MSPGARTPGFLQGITLLLPITMNVMGISVLTPVVHLMLTQFKDVPYHDYMVIGGVLTMPAIWFLIFSPIAGWLADRCGRRKLLLVAMVVYAFVGIAPAFLSNLNAIIASRIAVGICESIVVTASTCLIGDYFSGHARERWMASQTAVASISALGIIYLGGVLGSAYGWRGPFYLYIYSLVLAFGVYALVWEPPVERADPGDVQLDGASVHFPWARMTGICSLTLLASTCFYTVVTKNAEAMVSLGVSDPAIIGKYTMLASIGVPLGTFIYWGVARWPIRWLLTIDFAVLGFGFVLMGTAANPSGYAWGSFINQLGCGMVLPTMLVWATRGLTYAIRGRGIGMWQASFAIGQFVSGMAVTLLSGPAGGLLPALRLMGEAAGLIAIGAAAIGTLWNRTPPARAVRT